MEEEVWLLSTHFATMSLWLTWWYFEEWKALGTNNAFKHLGDFICGGGGLSAPTYTKSGPQPQECRRSTFLPGEEGHYQHVRGGQDSVHLPHTDDCECLFQADMIWDDPWMGYLSGRRTPGPNLQPAQRSPAQECGRSTFLLGRTSACVQEETGGHPPTRTRK